MADHTVFKEICDTIDRDFGILNDFRRNQLKDLVEKGMRDAWERSRQHVLEEQKDIFNA